MNIKTTTLDGCFIIKPKVFDDKRGYFFESFHQKKFQELTGVKTQFVQDNQSMSQRGVLRGLHFQTGKFAQSKLVRVIKGSVLDVAVDLRKDSSTFGKHFSIILSEKNKLQLFIPKGFAHGFAVLEDDTIFSYKCDNYYNKLAEDGVMYNDPDLHIDWMLDENEIQLSEKDESLSSFKEYNLQP
ncbi:MAG: dTDP-4-dehydrorhamnose 3,5-epimerase [Flavobacterium sp. SCGC AAA160-P02]|nr:MAG: dTDP-4-dehydrorhamnose 3,5-epimerase [Flavobacterium sp. SCGC AAA160-P02]